MSKIPGTVDQSRNFFFQHPELGKTKSGLVVGNSISEYQLGLDRLSFTAPGEEAMRAAGVPAQDVERFIAQKLP